MGACSFFAEGRGKNAKEAFRAAVEEAEYDYGHAGYTGTIAEKDSYVMIDLPAGIEPEDYADMLIQKQDARIDSKWGPAGCLLVKEGERENTYLFFGWASS